MAASISLRKSAIEAELSEEYKRFLLPSEMRPIVETFLEQMRLQFDPQDTNYHKFQTDLRENCRRITGDIKDLGGTVYQIHPDFVVKIGRPHEVACIQAIVEDDSITNLDYHDNLQRVVMDEELRRVIREESFDVIIPSEWLVLLPLEGEVPEFLRYVVVAERVEFWEGQEMVEQIMRMDESWQVMFIDYLCSFIYKGGIVDASFTNLCLSKSEKAFYFGQWFPKIVVVDTEPLGYWRGYSLAEAAFAGLYTFSDLMRMKYKFCPVVMRKVDEWFEKAKRELPTKLPKVVSKTMWGILRQKLGL